MPPCDTEHQRARLPVPYAFPVPGPDLATLASSLPASDPDRCRSLLGLLGHGLSVVEPETAVVRALTSERLPGRDLTVVAVGKASPAMARGAAAALGDRVRHWLVVSDHSEPVPAGAELLVTAHPIPDLTSLEAGRRLLETVRIPVDHIVFLVSGGGSALAEVPCPGIGLEDLAGIYDLLLKEGVAIEDANVVRSHLSALKGGKLAAAAAAPMTTVVLSDVGPRLDLVASGPSIPSSSRPADARAVLDRLGLMGRLPDAARTALEQDDGPPAIGGRVISAGDGEAAATAIAAAGVKLGMPISVITTSLDGEAVEAARWALQAVRQGEVGVMAGETTVTVRGSGRGGRNQEAALSAAIAMEGGTDAFVALGTDGIDGPTDAAGAYVDGTTAKRMRAAGSDPVAALANNDSHRALDAAAALIRTGPTGINVADLWLVDRR